MHAINPPHVAIPGLSQAMLIESGHLLILSGHMPLRADGTMPSDLAAQLHQVFENIGATLQSAGVGFEAVARLTIYVRDYQPEMLPTIRTVRDHWVNAEQPPASALIGVAAPFNPDVLVEVDALAVVPTT